MSETKNVSEICLQIEQLVKAQDIPFDVYSQVTTLLTDVIHAHNEAVKTATITIENIDPILKEVYLDIGNNYDVSDLHSSSDIKCCVASAFRDKVWKKIKQMHEED